MGKPFSPGMLLIINMREFIMLLIQYIAKGNARQDVGTALLRFYSSEMYVELVMPLMIEIHLLRIFHFSQRSWHRTEV